NQSPSRTIPSFRNALENHQETTKRRRSPTRVANLYKRPVATTVGAVTPVSMRTNAPSLTPKPAGASTITYPHSHAAAKAPVTVTMFPASGIRTAKDNPPAIADIADHRTGRNHDRLAP